MRSHVIDVAGFAIHVEEEGTGPDVVLLHGFTGSAATMKELGSTLDRHQLRIDLVGHGHSSAPASVDPYCMDAMVDQVATVIDEMVDGPVDLVGYSLGGRVALSMLVARSELVRKASLIGVSPGIRSASERADRVVADEALAATISNDGLATFVDSWMALPMWASLRSARTPEWWAQSRVQRLASSSIGLANSLRGAGTGAMPHLFDDLTDISVPVQLIVGELDEKFRATADLMHQALPDSIVSMIVGAGHAAHLESPGETSLAIVGFLQ